MVIGVGNCQFASMHGAVTAILPNSRVIIVSHFGQYFALPIFYVPEPALRSHVARVTMRLRNLKLCKETLRIRNSGCRHSFRGCGQR